MLSIPGLDEPIGQLPSNDDSTITESQLLKNIMMGRINSTLTAYQKFADITPYKILEENLMISCDGTEVIFKVIQEENQQKQVQYMSVDLVDRVINVWNKNFGDVVMTNINPYSIVALQKRKVADYNSLPQCTVIRQVNIKDIQHMRRSMVDNRCLILTIVQMTEEGRKQI